MDYWEKKALEAEAEAERKRIRTDQDLVSLTELVKRWRGATEQEILTEERTGRLVAFYREKTVLNPDTLAREHWLHFGQIPTRMNYDEEYLDLSYDCLFLKNNIVEIERRRPDFLYIREDVEESEKSNQGDTENQKNELQILIDRCAEITRLKDMEISRLVQECTEKQALIQELEAQLAAPAPVTNKTAPASAAKQENALAAWKPVIPAMLEVYHQCIAEGPTQRTKKDLERLFTRQGVELTQAQMAFFRDCLPEGHVNKTGGATVQKS